MGTNMPQEMTGAELKSMLKSNVNFKSLGGVRCEELNLKPEDKKWWTDAKIGMFIHWGLYAILGRGEWVRFNEQIAKEEYEALADEFIPEDFSMQEWMDLARDFGANYCVMVTKHHDGFALWNSDSSYEQFDSWHRGAHRDFVEEYIEACRANGLRAGLYYSPMDWRFPGYFDPEGMPENAALMKKQCYGQIEELCSRFQPVDILWYDGGWLAHQGSDTSSAWFWEPVKLNKLARKYNPKMLINPRSGWEGDFYCDEGPRDVMGKIIPLPWEKNMNVGKGTWGYMPDTEPYDFDWLIQMMVKVVCRGGNWLLNIGPDRNGKISNEIKQRMHEIGDWLRQYGDSIYGTSAGPYQPVDEVYGSTCRGNQVYLHIQDVEAFRQEVLPKINNMVYSARLWNGEKLDLKESAEGIKIILPVVPDEPDVIVVLEMAEAVRSINQEAIYFTGKE